MRTGSAATAGLRLGSHDMSRQGHVSPVQGRYICRTGSQNTLKPRPGAAYLPSSSVVSNLPGTSTPAFMSTTLNQFI